MQKSDKEMIEKFQLKFLSIESAFIQFFSNQFNNQSIAINSSPFNHKQFVCLLDKNDSKCLTIAEFLVLCIEKWKEEIIYEQKILALKDLIIESLNTLCSELENEELKDKIREERQIIVQELYRLCQIDQKKKAGTFCKGLMNGLDKSVLKDIEDYVMYVLFKPLIAAFPVDFSEHINKILKVVIVSQDDVIDCALKIKQFIETNFKPDLINASEIDSAQSLQEIIELASEKNKPISIFIEGLNKHKFILKNKRSKISLVRVKMKVNDFLKEDIPFWYEELEFTDIEMPIIDKKLMEKLPKTLTKLFLELSIKFNENEITQLSNFPDQVHSRTEVIFDFREYKLDANKCNALIKLYQQTKCNKCLLLNEFIYENHQATDKELEEISNMLQKSTQLKTLKINCSGDNLNRITNIGVKKVAEIIEKNKKLLQLELNFSNRISYW